MDTNVTILSGRATKDTELRTTTGGTQVATISLAVNHKDDLTSYFECVCFGKTAETAGKYVNKGKQVNVVGRLQQRKWQDKEGNNRYSVEVVVNQLQLLGGKNDTERSNDVVIEDIDDKPISLDDIPF